MNSLTMDAWHDLILYYDAIMNKIVKHMQYYSLKPLDLAVKH